MACVKAGAAIVHVHAYDEASGRQTENPEAIRRIIEGIRNQVDAIVYPTIPTTGLEGQAGGQSPQQRFAHIEELARRGLIEWAAVDPGSVNFALYDDLREDQPGFVYLNPEEHIRHGLDLARRYAPPPELCHLRTGFRPARRDAALARELPGADLSVHVLQRLYLQLPAGGLRPDGVPEAARPGRPGRAMDDRGLAGGHPAHGPRGRSPKAGMCASGWRMRFTAAGNPTCNWSNRRCEIIANSGGELAGANDVRAGLTEEEQIA